jgi:hypothetical protein
LKWGIPTGPGLKELINKADDNAEVRRQRHNCKEGVPDAKDIDAWGPLQGK